MKALIIKGKPGIGKGWLARKIAEMIGETYTLTDRVYIDHDAETIISDKYNTSLEHIKKVIAKWPAQTKWIFCTESIDIAEIEENSGEFVAIDLDYYIKIIRSGAAMTTKEERGAMPIFNPYRIQ